MADQMCLYRYNRHTPSCSLPKGHEGPHNQLGAGTPADPQFGIKEWTLVTVDLRVPRMGELYIDKNNRVQRLKKFRPSLRARKYPIVCEKWKLVMGMAASYIPPVPGGIDSAE